MIYLQLCNPETLEPFPSFHHNTTAYVAVPHGCPSRLWVGTDGPCTLRIEAEDQVVLEKGIDEPGEAITISDFNQPVVPPRGGFIPPFLQRFRSRQPVTSVRPLRMFHFTVTVSDKPLDKGGRLLASVEHHVLCPIDFDWAKSLHLKVLGSPEVISPWTIAEKAEGVGCPECGQVRLRLKGSEDNS